MNLPTNILCCPMCRGGLSIAKGADDSTTAVCTVCERRYPATEGIANFLPNPIPGPKGRGQRLMESEWMVKQYESKWWRGGKLFKRYTGVTLDEEIALVKQIDAAGPADTVLDLACGPGIYAQAFAQDNPARTVIGVDVSEPMLRRAVDKAAALNLANITFIHGDACALPLQDGSVDVANCCGALHLFTDVQTVLAELGRIVKPGGRFSASLAWVGRTPWSRIKAALDGQFWRMHFFRREEIEALLDEAGFEPTVHHAHGIWMIVGGVRRP